MSGVATVPIPLVADRMARKKSSEPSAAPDGGGQVNFRASPDLWTRLQTVSGGLGVDMANLVRMIVTENLHRYEERVDEIRRPKRDD